MSIEGKSLSCPWSPEDDKLLHFAYLLSGNWTKISVVMRKSERECEYRFVDILHEISLSRRRIICCYACTNRFVKNEQKSNRDWTEGNDRMLMTAVNIYGVKQWHKVAVMTGLSARFCEARWKSGLNKVFADGVKQQVLQKYERESEEVGIDEIQSESENICDDVLHDETNDGIRTFQVVSDDQIDAQSTRAVRMNLQYMFRILSFVLFLVLLCTLFYNILSFSLGPFCNFVGYVFGYTFVDDYSKMIQRNITITLTVLFGIGICYAKYLIKRKITIGPC